MYKSDSATLREALSKHKLPGSNTSRVYNDRRAGNTRRLKVQNYDFATTIPKKVWDAFVATLKAEFGVRFVKAEIYLDGWVPAVCVYLDDNKAPAPKREAKPVKKPAQPQYIWPEDRSYSELLEFWQTVLKINKGQKQITSEGLRRGVLRTTAVDIIVYKKVYGKGNRHVIATLMIPAGTQVHITYQKCRAAKAKVVALQLRTSGKHVAKAHSGYFSYFTYTVDAIVKPHNGFSRYREECAGGIHFFVNARQACAY